MHDLFFMTLRVDDVTEEIMWEFYEKYKDTFACIRISDEISDETKKQHMQGFIGYKEELTRDAIDKHRKNFQLFFKKKGGQFSYAKVKKAVEYGWYTIKQDNVILDCNVPKWFDEAVEEYVLQYTMAKEKKKEQKNPMLAIWEWFHPHYETKYKAWVKGRLPGPHNSHQQYLKHHPYIFVRYVIIWYGRIANKSFCRNKMAETAHYLEFKTRDKYVHKSDVNQTDEAVMEDFADLEDTLMNMVNKREYFDP